MHVVTDADWYAFQDPEPLLEYLRTTDGLSERKARLWACACVRRVWHLLADVRSQKAIETAEGVADGLVVDDEQLAAYTAAERAQARLWSGRLDRYDPDAILAAAATHTVEGKAADSMLTTFLVASWAQTTKGTSGRREELAAQVELLRHLIGCPFGSLRVPTEWPRAIVNVAEALYQGDDVAFALHDALLEAGFAEFAEHFRDRDHPKGCAWLDLILGKS